MKHIYIIIITTLFISCADKITTQKLSDTKSIPSLWEYSVFDTSGFVGQWWESFGDSVLNNVFIEFNANSPDLKTIASRLEMASQLKR